MSWAIRRDAIEAMVARHARMLGLPDTPEFGSEAWSDWVEDWYRALAREGSPTPGQVEEAMVRARAMGKSWWREQLPAVLESIRGIRAENYAQPDGPADAGPEESCPHCATHSTHGRVVNSGLATAFRRDYAAEPGWFRLPAQDDKGAGRIVYTRITAPCICPAGRRVLAAQQQAKNAVVDLALLPAGWGFTDPRLDDADENGDVAPAAPTRADIARMFPPARGGAA